MAVLRQGYRLVYAPAAHSVERSSLTEKDEAMRRSRIVAGRYHDRFARDGESWRFDSRHIRLEQVGDVHEHLAAGLIARLDGPAT